MLGHRIGAHNTGPAVVPQDTACQDTALAAARPAVRPVKRQPPTKVPSSER